MPVRLEGEYPMRNAGIICVVAAALVAAAGPAIADRIITFAGKTLVGQIIEEDSQNVVIRTDSETVTVPRVTIRTLEKGVTQPAQEGPEAGTSEGKGPAEPPPGVKPVKVAPEDAKKAFEEAKKAVGAGDWVKAGGLLEGLLELDESAFPAENRLGSLAVLATCYLQIKDARGAARSYARRALLVTDADEKRRLLAASEALRVTGSVAFPGKPLGRYEETIEAALGWKTNQLLTQAKESAAKATELHKAGRLEKAALLAQDRLKEADAYVAGFSEKHREEVLKALVSNVTDTAQQIVEFCTEERKDLSRTRLASLASKAHAAAWNKRGAPYLAKRQAAEEAVKNLKPFAQKFEVASLYDTVLCRDLLAKLDDLAYYPADAPRNPYSTNRGRMKIELRRF